MNWWIGIGIYKFKSGKYIILVIPDEMREVGYLEECYEENSNLLKEGEIRKLDKEQFGYYTLKLKPCDNISYNEVIENAKKNKYSQFVIENFIKRI